MSTTKEVIENYLKNNGVLDPQQIADIVGEFDLSRPVQEKQIWENDELHLCNNELCNNENILSAITHNGCWFSHKGSSQAFKVKFPIAVLQGTAKRTPLGKWLKTELKVEIGGASQMYIIKNKLFALEAL
jgi:hypothetical protein